MFLDEELLDIARSTPMEEKEILDACSDMITQCFHSLSKSINEQSSDQDILASFKRVNNTWIKVARIMKEEGIGFIREDGFKTYVECKPEFENVYFNE